METALLFLFYQSKGKTMLPKEAVKEYKKIYKDAYYIELSEAEATEMANDLFEFMQAVYLPANEDNLITMHENETRNPNQ